MTFLGPGDLAPPRRHRRRRMLRALALLLAVAVLGGGGYLAWHHLHGSGTPAADHSPAPCPTTSPAPAPAAAGDVAVRVLNSTSRQHLAHTVAAALRARGMRTRGVGNARPVLATTTIRYAAADAGAALTLAEQLPAHTMQLRAAGPLTLVLGRDFTALATVDEAAAARARDVAAARPHPLPCHSAAQ